MKKQFQAIRGMNDILPNETIHWQHLENTIQNIAHQYTFQEIRFPIVEHYELFQRSVGNVTDIVEKEMYVFEDRNGDMLCLRPEGTAGCVRAAIENGLLYNQIQRLWYQGPLFRHERPQKGRYRQFHQTGFELFGSAQPAADAEIILLCARLLRALNLIDHVTLEINSIGTAEERAKYREALVAYLTPLHDQLDADSQRRLSTNPLRILDSKNPDTQALLKNAPTFNDFLEEASIKHFETVKSLLSKANLSFTINPNLVRGLDYYCHTVFEWTTTQLGAQGTVCAGGRYDGLVEQLGGKPTPAIGCAFGMERLLELLENKPDTAHSDVYIAAMDENAFMLATQAAESIRSAHPNLKVYVHMDASGIKSQLKRANQHGAHIALLIGEQECAEEKVTLKYLQNEQAQAQCALNQLSGFIGEYFEKLL